MRRQVIKGGVIVVISVASAAAYNIVQGRWFNAATSPSATPAETASAASPSSPKAENQAEGPRAAAVGWPEPGGTTEPAPAAPQSATVAQAGARPLQAAPRQAATPPAQPATPSANP